ncbi:MAG: nuclear transport factor 2 family protein [Gammaproteobacteria bacterium]|nr:nuclear transport factor 2 family protein [Gammaproteobacteria bacterium]
MNQSIENVIEDCEERLKQAMLQSEISVLDELLSPELVFTNHLGQLMTKYDDMRAHESGVLKITEIKISGQKIKFYGVVAVVLVQAHILGSFAGVESESDFRFTRVWSKGANETWQVVAVHSSIIL